MASIDIFLNITAKRFTGIFVAFRAGADASFTAAFRPGAFATQPENILCPAA